MNGYCYEWTRGRKCETRRAVGYSTYVNVHHLRYVNSFWLLYVRAAGADLYLFELLDYD